MQTDKLDPKISRMASIVLKAVRSCSRDSRLKVGAIILRDNRIISTGYNGQLPGIFHKPIIREGHDISTVHAEQNALMHCLKYGTATKDCVLFVTHFPCVHCVKLAVMAGIRKIYYLYPYLNEENPFYAVIPIERFENDEE